MCVGLLKQDAPHAQTLWNKKDNINIWDVENNTNLSSTVQVEEESKQLNLWHSNFSQCLVLPKIGKKRLKLDRNCCSGTLPGQGHSDQQHPLSPWQPPSLRPACCGGGGPTGVTLLTPHSPSWGLEKLHWPYSTKRQKSSVMGSRQCECLLFQGCLKAPSTKAWAHKWATHPHIV